MIVRFGSISSVPRRKFDFIVANIDFRTISRFIKSLSVRVRKQGIIIVSGILTSDLPELLKVFSINALLPLDRINENEWTSIALRRIE
jgi:ribosomal protein L11 methylase PrmA